MNHHDFSFSQTSPVEGFSSHVSLEGLPLKKGSTAESSWLWIRTLAQHGSVGGQWVVMKYYVSYYEW